MMQNSLSISDSSKNNKIIRVIAFILILSVALIAISKPLSFKYDDGINQFDAFYDLEKDTLDVLVIGTSHAYVNINPVVMYEEEGIAAFNLCASMQPMWNSYFFFKEALKYQKPKLLVLEGYGTFYDDEYDVAQIVKNNYGLRWSPLRIESLIASVSLDELGEYFFELSQSHNRYEELQITDFYDTGKYEKSDTWLGQEDHFIVEEQVPVVFEDTGYRATMNEKTEKYYRMILQLAKDEGIPVAVVITPYPRYYYDEACIFNTAELIASEYGAEFIDFNLYVDDIGLDYSTDYADMVHMNYKGNEKFSDYFSEYLVKNYDLPDRRGDETYCGWDKEAQLRKTYILDNLLSLQNDFSEYSKLLDKTTDYDNYIFLLNKVSDGFVDEAYIYDAVEEVFFANRKLEESFYYSPYKFSVLEVDEGLNLRVNNSVYNKTKNGYNLVIYDKNYEDVIDCVGIELLPNSAISDSLIR